MRRTLILLLATLLAVAGVVVIQRLNQDRLYRGLLADGDRAMAAGHTYAAVEAYSGALALRPTSMVAYYRRGEAYLSDGQELLASRDLREARRLSPEAPEPLEALGRLYDRRGEYVLAADWYELASSRLQDTDPRLLYALALAHYRTGAFAEAREAAQLAVERDDSFAEGHYLLGLVARDTQDPREAIRALEQAVRLRPSFAAARQELASIYREQQRTDDSLEQLTALATLDGGRGNRQIALAMEFARAARYEEALRTLAAVETAAPGDSRVVLATGRVHLAIADATREPEAIAQALAALERALGGTARRSEGLALYGRALHLAGQLEAAERLLQDATHTSPVAPEAYGFLADTAQELRHPRIARDALLALDALEGDTAARPARAARALRIGTLSLEAGDPHLAVEHLTLAVRATPPEVRALELLARAHWQADQPDEARRTLDAAFILAPADPALLRLEKTMGVR